MKNTFPRFILAGAVALCGGASAQSSVTLYGIADIGYTYQSNVAGSSLNAISSGIMRASRLGFRGKEDLGGGNAAIFTLEMGLNLDDGSLGQGGLLFGRQSFVGLEGPWGTFTAGRQYTFSTDYLVTLAAGNYNGVYAFHPGDIDRVGGSERANGSLKFSSANYGGLRFGLMHGMGDPAPTAGAPRLGRLTSAGATYADGPLVLSAAVTRKYNFASNLGAGLGINTLFSTTVGATNPLTGAITSSNTLVNQLTTTGLGGSYTVGDWKLKALATGTQIKAQGHSGTYTAYEASPELRITPLTTASVGYARLGFEGDHWNQFSAGLAYALSKRTDVYTVASVLKGSQNTRASTFGGAGSASGRDQTLLRVGIRHVF